MKYLKKYLDKYGDISFKDKKLNDVDNLIFTSLAYLDFSNCKDSKKNTIEIIGKDYLKNNKYKDIAKLCNSKKVAYSLLKLIINKKRYKDIKIKNFEYKKNESSQFSAVTFHISHKLEFIAFEGTDEYISGWKENCHLACSFPVPAHIEAIRYINKHVKMIGPSVIIGGHSKGGNLALVAAMYLKKYKQNKIIKIYNNDGPGLRKKEFESDEFNRIKNRYVHIVPDCSFVGVLLRHDNYKVVKSVKNNIYGHVMDTWVIEDDKLVNSKLSTKSLKLENNLITWLELHNDEDKKYLVDSLFNILNELKIHDTLELKKIKNLFRIFKKYRSMDKELKDLTKDLIKYNLLNAKN